MTFVRSRISQPLVWLALALALAVVLLGALVPAGARAAAPVISDVGVYRLSDTSVRLVGTVDPSSLSTGYVFQYGKSQAIVEATDPVGIGNGATPVTVSQQIDGLEPGTTYHYRLIASNSSGATPTPFQQFTTRVDPLPNPDGRGFEMVSPAVKSGSVNEAGEGQYKATVAADGQSLGYCTSSPLGAQVGQLCGNYIAQRHADGWATKTMLPDFCGQDLEGTGAALAGVPRVLVSLNLDYTAVGVPETSSCQIPKLDPAAPTPAWNLYRQDMRAIPATFDLLAPMPAFSQDNNIVGPVPMGASDDFSHVVYASTGQQAAGAPVNNVNKLYDWHNGQINLVSRGTDNLPLTTASALAGFRLLANTYYGYGSVSDDGRRVFFQSTVPGVTVTNPGGINNAAAGIRLYMREDNAATYELGRTECTATCGSAFGEVFQWASEDGSRALFFSKEKLVDSDTVSTVGNDLYMYRHSADPVADQNLSLLTADNEPADGTDGRYRGILGMSDDGDTVYFIASGQLVAGETIADGPKLYQWRWNGGSPVLRYLAKFDGDGNGLGVSQDSYMWVYAPPNNDRAIIRRVAADGSSLLVDTVVALDAVVDRDSTRDVYRWTEESGWVCLSCQVPGELSAGPSSIQGPTYPQNVDGNSTGQQNGYRQDGELITVSSRDGRRVFFTSMDRLVDGDVNSVEDVYAWHDGRVSLISGGTGSHDSTLIGVSDDAEDVFFSTANRLVGWDFDGFIDFYDARVGGGFPEPPAQPQECEVQASECQAPPADAFDPKVVSGGGSDNATSGDRIRLAVAGVSRQARARAARRGVLRLSARTSSAGSVAFRVRARIAGRNRVVGQASDRATGAGAVGVSVRLSRQARKRLAAGKRLRLSVVVSQPGARSRTATFVLRGVKS